MIGILPSKSVYKLFNNIFRNDITLNWCNLLRLLHCCCKKTSLNQSKFRKKFPLCNSGFERIRIACKMPVFFSILVSENIVYLKIITINNYFRVNQIMRHLLESKDFPVTSTF